MRHGTIAVMTTVFWLAAAAVGYAADVAKIGVVDFQRILKTSDAGKKAQAEINARGKKIERELKERGSEIEEMRQKLEREALVMSKEMRDEKEREIRIRINDFKEMQAKYISDFKAEEGRLIKEIKATIDQLVETLGNKEGYLLIVEKHAGVLYAPDSIDLTDRVIQMYNAEYARTKTGSTGASSD